MSRNAKLKRSALLVSAIVLLGTGLSACNRDKSSAALLAEAKQYQQKGDRKAALIQLKNAVAQSPEDGEARIALGALQLELGDIPSADKEIRKAASLGISAERTMPLLARTLQAQGKFKELLDQITPEKAKNSAPLLALRGDAFMATGDAAQAKASYEQALALNPNSGEALVGLARQAMVAKDTRRRRALHRRRHDARTQGSGSVDVPGGHAAIPGQARRSAGRPRQGAGAQARAPAPPISKRRISKSARASTTPPRPTSTPPTRPAPATCWRCIPRPCSTSPRARTPPRAIRCKKSCAARRNTCRASCWPARSSSSLVRSSRPKCTCANICRADPNNLYARKLLAQTQLKGANPNDAVATLEPLLKAPTQDAHLLAVAGESYMQARKFDQAIVYFEKAIALAPKTSALYTSLGLSRISAGQQEQGVSDLEKAVALDPKSAQAGTALAQVQLRLKHYDKALAAAQALEQQQPGSADVQNLKGGIYLAQGNRANARAAFDKAVSLQPTFLPAVGNLAQLDVQDGKPEAAKQRLEAVLAKDPRTWAP